MIWDSHDGGSGASSQPTYEELKRSRSPLSRVRSSRSQPTYEELKLILFCNSLAGLQEVPSLPMRN